MDEINERLDLLNSKVFDIEQKTDEYQKVCDIREIIEWNDKLCYQMQTNINELEQYSSRNSIRIFGIEKQTNEKTNINKNVSFQNKSLTLICNHT